MMRRPHREEEVYYDQDLCEEFLEDGQEDGVVEGEDDGGGED